MKAPYRVGDKISVLHSCDHHGTAAAVVAVDRIVELNTHGVWRIESRRCDGSAMHLLVDKAGRDRHGYVERVTAVSP